MIPALSWRRPNAGRRPMFRRPGLDGPVQKRSEESHSSARQPRARSESFGPVFLFTHMFGFLKKILSPGGGLPAPGKLAVAELARRLAVSEQELRGVAIEYRTFTLPKRTGGTRTIAAPADPLKAMQRKILRRLLGRLRAHPC